MKKMRISTKLFIITSLSLLLLLSLQLIFQGLFLEKFYTKEKKIILTEELSNLHKKLESKDREIINHELFIFSQKFDVVSGIVNLYGSPLYGFEIEQNFIEVQTEDGKLYKVYIDSFINNPSFQETLKKGKTIKLEGSTISESSLEFYPVQLEIDDILFQNSSAMSASAVPMQKHVLEAIQAVPAKESLNISMQSTPSNYTHINGTIDGIYITQDDKYRMAYRQNKLLEEVNLFLQQLATTNGQLQIGEIIMCENTDTFVGVKNMIGIMPFILDEQPVLLLGMMSLHQIKETTQIMIRYTILIFIIVLIFSLIMAYIYSKKLTRPLVTLRNITYNITNLKFDEICEVNSSDEIGELAQNINAMSHTLKETLATLHEDINKRKRFMADASHELKTPLTVLKGICEGLENGLYDPSEKKHIKTMLYHINDMSELVQELLFVSKSEKSQELHLEQVDLTNVFLRVHRKLKPLIIDKHLEVTMTLDESVVIADKKQLETVLKNIYSNAIFYTPENQHIKIESRELSGKQQFSIENEGIHIDETKLPKLWEPFYRAEESRNKALGGSGLGLYIVKQILDTHKADYGIENTQKGVKVWFIL